MCLHVLCLTQREVYHVLQINLVTDRFDIDFLLDWLFFRIKTDNAKTKWSTDNYIEPDSRGATKTERSTVPTVPGWAEQKGRNFTQGSNEKIRGDHVDYSST